MSDVKTEIVCFKLFQSFMSDSVPLWIANPYLMDRNGKWRLSPAYDITYSKGMLKSHTTTIAGKDLNITRDDILKIAKSQSIKLAVAARIIDECIKVAKNFRKKAIDLELDEDTIATCRRDIDKQIELLLV